MNIEEKLRNMKPSDTPLLWLGYTLLGMMLLLSLPAKANDNEINIEQTGDNFTLTVEQKGENNLITGLTTTDALITGADNVLNIQQGYKGNNTLNLYLNGPDNYIKLMQERGTGYDTNSYGHHEASINVSGSYNTVEIVQRNNNDSSAGHSSNVRLVNGYNNIIKTLQTGTGGTNGHLSWVYTHNGESNNTVDIFQNSDTADHVSYVSLYTDGNTVDINQTGTSQNNAYVLFSGNSTGPIDFTLNQNGGNTYGNPNTTYVSQVCYNAGGCTVSVTQN